MLLDIERDKLIIQFSRKPGLAYNQRWKYQDGYLSPGTGSHLALDVKGEYKPGNNVYLALKDLNSRTQQWQLESFDNVKSKAELALLRPSPIQRTSTFPREDELYDSYRMVYLENRQNVSNEQLVAAAAFKGLKNYVYFLKREGRPIVADESKRDELLGYIQAEVSQILLDHQINNDRSELMHQALNVAESYYNREYNMN
ncbi:hypothetical protein BDB01DRAFT_721121 [Pilobolus umbonatus]|nr:hypothetical protein BDB01DRAFT_721121 [Pilobolus umbonatus]